MEHNPVTMIIPQKPRRDSLIQTVLYMTYIRSHGGESYKQCRRRSHGDKKNGTNTGKTGLWPGLLATREKPLSLKMVVPKAHYKELHLLNFATANSKHVKPIKYVLINYTL